MAESKHGADGATERRRESGHGGGRRSAERQADAPGPLADAAPSGTGLGEPRDIVERALEMAKRGDESGAVMTLRAFLSSAPADVRGREALSRLLEHRGDLIGAAAELGRALDLQPEHVSLLCRRGALLTALQRYDLAESDLRRAARLDDADAGVQLQLGILACKRACWRDAIDPLERAVELDPDEPLGHYYLAEAYNQTDRLGYALLEYEAVVRLEPANWRALKGVGIVLDKLGRPAEASLAYRRAREAQRR